MAAAIHSGLQNDILIGSGGFGRVYRGMKGQINGPAIEVARKVFNDTIEDIDNMQYEIRILQKLGSNCHFLVSMLASSLTDLNVPIGLYYIDFQFYPQGDLQHYIYSNQHAWNEDRVFIWLFDILHGIEYMHDGLQLAHKDLKPNNILLSADLHALICDFGGAGPITNVNIGTDGYMAPEHTGVIYKNYDIWSIARILIDAIDGQYTWAITEQKYEHGISNGVFQLGHRRIPVLSSALDHLIHSMICPNKNLRPTAAQILDKLQLVYKMEALAQPDDHWVRWYKVLQKESNDLQVSLKLTKIKLGDAENNQQTMATAVKQAQQALRASKNNQSNLLAKNRRLSATKHKLATSIHTLQARLLNSKTKCTIIRRKNYTEGAKYRKLKISYSGQTTLCQQLQQQNQQIHDEYEQLLVDHQVLKLQFKQIQKTNAQKTARIARLYLHLWLRNAHIKKQEKACQSIRTSSSTASTSVTSTSTTGASVSTTNLPATRTFASPAGQIRFHRPKKLNAELRNSPKNPISKDVNDESLEEDSNEELSEDESSDEHSHTSANKNLIIPSKILNIKKLFNVSENDIKRCFELAKWKEKNLNNRVDPPKYLQDFQNELDKTYPNQWSILEKIHGICVLSLTPCQKTAARILSKIGSRSREGVLAKFSDLEKLYRKI